ncbi:uncharacterized protein LMH87_008500 [Akanthomyces muscarius]|uniref:Uncharacterized protein n=1 Tax=Akanthomyces muscarius TaxID=2231603 RepID=A0A9W8QHB0_AKAMU|nr:uncharacterized protein LMH87_008500 [Akanthomyces muscarius]KAJ4157948.1 hypothetical protein LMH87_008500 [Akanthomyces muscarius]
MLPTAVLALCAIAMAAPLPNPQAVPFIDINANNNKLDFPINVLGFQTHDISAANGNLSPNQASVPAAQSPAPAVAEPPAPAAESTNEKGINGNTLNFPINVLGAQTHDIAAFNGNGSPNRAQAPAAQAPVPAAQAPVPVAQAVKAQGGSKNGSYVIPSTVTAVPVAAAAPNALMGAVSGMTAALYNLASAITSATGGKA